MNEFSGTDGHTSHRPVQIGHSICLREILVRPFIRYGSFAPKGRSRVCTTFPVSAVLRAHFCLIGSDYLY